MKIVINTCYGGYGVSEEVYKEIGIEHGDQLVEDRANPRLIAAIEKIGLEKSSDKHSKLKIIDIPDNILWAISEYDGVEQIDEKCSKCCELRHWDEQGLYPVVEI